MILASAYPSSDISALSMTIIALVMVGSLAVWIVMVYLAASERSERRSQRARGVTVAVADKAAKTRAAE